MSENPDTFGMKSCENCKRRYYRNPWDKLIETCLHYEMSVEENGKDPARVAESCPQYAEGTPDCFDREEARDYSPSAPWNAPGMSPRDFY